MRSATVIILQAFVMQGFAKEQLTQVQMDNLVDKLVDKLAGKFLGGLSTGVQTRAMPSLPPQMAALPGPMDFKRTVVNQFAALNNRGCQVRDVSMKADAAVEKAAPEPTALATADIKYPLMLNGKSEPLTESAVKEMAGVTAPLGLFDPLGISTSVPEGQLMFYREAELKHGRVCMLAILGLVVGDRHDFFPILGAGIDPSVPAWKFATPFVQETPLKDFWPIVVGALFFEEWRRESARSLDGMDAGDYGWDPLGLKPKVAAEMKQLQNKELNNGRLAMLATAGWIAQEELTGNKIWPFLS